MVSKEVEKLLLKVQKPGRYVGGELNAVVKNKKDVDVRFAFCFPDTYEVGMSHLGMKILYSLFNSIPHIWCERVFAPWIDMEEEMIKNNIPLYALESGDPVSDFDFIGFTLQYELSFTNVLNMLKLSGVPIKSCERTGLKQIVVAGGPCTCNPEPIADFIDLFFIGEGEEVDLEVIELFRKCRAEGKSKQEFLELSSKIEGVYVPALYDVTYNEDGTIKSFTPKGDAPAKIHKRIMLDMDKSFYPDNFVVPIVEIVHDRAVQEIFRGCIRGCRFCQAGMIYRPNREKKVDHLKDVAAALIKNTGHDEISLSSLSSSDYKELDELITFLLDICKEKKINISLPSLRIDAFSLDIMQKVQDVKKSSLTFAPEAGTQRLRNVINKGLTVDDIMNGSKQAFEGGWNKVKFYFMLGLPTETEEDMRGIPELANDVAALYYDTVPKEKRAGKCQITISTSFFVPKPFTPFQWARMYEPSEYLGRAKIVNDHVKEQLNRKSIRYNWHEAYVTVIEGILARGDRRLCDAIVKVYEKGGYYDAWTEYFDYDRWIDSIKECGLDPDFYTMRERPLDEVFPWDFIDIGVTKQFMIREWETAHKETVTPNCRMRCSACGAKSYGGGVCYEN